MSLPDELGLHSRTMSVLTTAQAAEQIGRSAVRHRIHKGEWQRPARGVVVTHNGPLSSLERHHVALAAAPPGSALAGLTALELAGLQNFTSPRTFVSMPNGSRKPSVPGLEAHQSIHLDADVVPLRSPRRTTVARAVFDAASWCGNDRLARAIVIATFQQGLTSVRHMREAVQRRPTQLRRGLVIESVLDASGGIQSLPERDFEQIRVDAGLSRPTRQFPVRGADGRYFLDAYFEAEGLAVEVHGIPHMAVSQWDADLVRANEIVIRGDRVLAFSSYAIRHERDAVIDQLRRAVSNAAPRLAS